MKIGIDIDDTICDTWKFLIPYLSEYFNIEKKKLEKSQKCYFEACNCTLEEYCKFAKKYYDKLALEFELKDFVVEILNKLQKDGNQIIFITARSNNGYINPYKTSYDYLKKHNVPFDKLIVSANDKASVCLKEKIDIFIDDSVNNCINVSKENIPVLLFDASFNRKCKLFKRVSNWQEVYEEVERMKSFGR